jgi:hypothetical protein
MIANAVATARLILSTEDCLAAVAQAVDSQVRPCHIWLVKTKKPAASESPRKSCGTKLVEKYRPRMSRLSDIEGRKLMARGLQSHDH